MTQLSHPKTYENENGGRSVVQEVKEAGDLRTYGGQAFDVKEGDYVASTGRPDEYVKLESLDGLQEVDPNSPPAEEKSSINPAKREVNADELPTDGSFNPSKHDAKTVHAYLSREDVSDEEYVRVRDAELAGKNRKTALPE